MKIFPAKRLEGTIRVPGDKSVSHRAVMMASIAEGPSRITNFAPGEDCSSTISCMRQLGVTIEREGDTVLVYGVGKHGLKPSAGPIDCGNSGTTMRLLAGILAGQPFESVLTGDDSLERRPMKRIIEPLTEMGATIFSNGGFPPLTIHGGRLKGIQHTPPVSSAQVKSCILLAGLFADGETTVNETTLTRDHTERMLKAMGDDLTAIDIDVPGDISSAAFFLVAAAGLPDSALTLERVGVNPTRLAIVKLLAGLGAEIGIDNLATANGELFADMTIRNGLKPQSRPMVLDGSAVAGLIDEIPILAVLGTQITGGIEVRDAGELRVKESDRIAAIVKNLQKMGANVTEFEDGFRVERSQLKGAVIDSYDDHRIAMAFAVAGLFAEGETGIMGAECVDVSYPGFFKQLEEVAVR